MKSAPPVRLSAFLALCLAFAAALVGLTATPSAAAPVYEITGEWEANTPDVVAKGDVVTGVWRVNVNDDQPAPSNEPVDNVTFSVTLENGAFKALPDLCLTTAGLDPVSSLSDDGRTLTCNLGSVKQGTAVVVQAPVVVDGTTGSKLTASGEIAGQTADLDPIDIRNTFGMDMLWGTPTPTVIPSPGGGAGDVDFDFEWTLFQDVGSDAGPNTITYNLSVPLENGQALELGQQTNNAPFDQACTPFSQGRSAPGHPYSPYSAAGNRAPFVESCELVKTGPNTFRLTLTGIDYSQTQVPTTDSAGNPMPTDRVAVASGSIWLRVRDLASSTSANLTASAPTYTSVTGQTDPDETANNRSSKVVTLPGTWSHAFLRSGGGTSWDNTLELSPGGLVTDQTHDAEATTTAPLNAAIADCKVLDTRFVDYQSVAIYTWAPGDPIGTPEEGLGTLAWYVGNDPTVTPGSAGYNPDAFRGCETNTGWVTTEPTDLTTVKAVRWSGTVGLLQGQHLGLRVTQQVEADAPIGQDIWTWGSFLRDGVWQHPGRGSSGAGRLTPTPGERYPYTANGRDILHVIFAVPNIRKLADRQVVRPGEPVTFTLRYSANGSGELPPTVDDYRIVDTLPPGMTYVAGSATPEPAVATSGGRQVLTWDLDDVPTNALQNLTYQAVADDSVTPGQTLTNTVTSTLRGETSRPATAQVTVSASGYTEISKSADTPFIPNLDGQGDGEGAWTVTLRSFDPLPQAFTDTIDILPYRGDQRGTDYQGDYALAAVDAVAGATVYYTTADPTTLDDDPAHDSNGAPGDVTGNDVGWTTTFTPDATAVRVIGPVLDPGATQAFQVRVRTDGAKGEDTFVNRAQGRTGHTELRMRTSAPMTVANFYSVALKKYVLGRDGKWHDAQDVTDYPSFRYGDKIRYRIVVENTGQGTVTGLEVSDDRQPELGRFVVDSLAPGEKKTHEYEITLDSAVSGSVVNTACATADVPADSQVPPTINCDPAGFDVANYTTEKKADPKPGRTVEPGDVVTYTVTVTQQGTAPANAEMVDDLEDVLDDASYNRDVKASLGTAQFRDGKISWSGTIPVGAVATITYSVTVDGDGDLDLANVVTSPGCAVVDGDTPRCKTAHPLPDSEVGGLPLTGGPGLGLMVGGAALLLGGGGLVAWSRRRRTTAAA
ncbi:hypothetical protein ACJ5H2_02755 [Nocardioides sp. R1-1]|uniref:DUF7927 domain-containing protein n=1 Tax=Nocardioides sp. R1-1 TaxID=3383502 RepID=UPI0038D13769